MRSHLRIRQAIPEQPAVPSGLDTIGFYGFEIHGAHAYLIDQSLKDQDKLQYCETVNREMSHRNQEIVGISLLICLSDPHIFRTPIATPGSNRSTSLHRSSYLSFAPPEGI